MTEMYRYGACESCKCCHSAPPKDEEPVLLASTLMVFGGETVDATLVLLESMLQVSHMSSEDSEMYNCIGYDRDSVEEPGLPNCFICKVKHAVDFWWCSKTRKTLCSLCVASHTHPRGSAPAAAGPAPQQDAGPSSRLQHEPILEDTDMDAGPSSLAGPFFTRGPTEPASTSAPSAPPRSTSLRGRKRPKNFARTDDPASAAFSFPPEIRSSQRLAAVSSAAASTSRPAPAPQVVRKKCTLGSTPSRYRVSDVSGLQHVRILTNPQILHLIDLLKRYSASANRGICAPCQKPHELIESQITSLAAMQADFPTCVRSPSHPTLGQPPMKLAELRTELSKFTKDAMFDCMEKILEDTERNRSRCSRMTHMQVARYLVRKARKVYIQICPMPAVPLSEFIDSYILHFMQTERSSFTTSVNHLILEKASKYANTIILVNLRGECARNGTKLHPDPLGAHTTAVAVDVDSDAEEDDCADDSDSSSNQGDTEADSDLEADTDSEEGSEVESGDVGEQETYQPTEKGAQQTPQAASSQTKDWSKPVAVWLFLRSADRTLVNRVLQWAYKHAWKGFSRSRKDSGVASLKQLIECQAKFKDSTFLIYQHHGETVIVRPGWVHTVTNLRPCIKIATEVLHIADLTAYLRAAKLLHNAFQYPEDYTGLKKMIIKRADVIHWAGPAACGPA